jgi:hypothetical protein
LPKHRSEGGSAPLVPALIGSALALVLAGATTMLIGRRRRSRSEASGAVGSEPAGSG